MSSSAQFLADVPNGLCSVADWSVSSSASTYSQLAGVLAGFVFTGLVLVLGRKRTPSDTRTLALFLTAFIVLALASYLYGVVSGDTLPAACGRAETVDNIASSMLALGSAALVSGLAWLLAGHFDPNAANAKESDFTTISKLLDVIRRDSDGHDGHGVELASRLVVYGVTFVAVALLSLTVATDVNIAYSGRSPFWLAACVQIIPVATLVIAMVVKAVSGWSKAKTVSKTEKESVGRTVTICVLSSILYGVVGTVVAGAFTNIPVTDWHPIPLWVMAFTVLVSIVLPTPILVALVFTVPRFLTRGRLVSESVRYSGEEAVSS